jgi:hypothetical protein
MFRRCILVGLAYALTAGATPMPTPKTQCEQLLKAVLPFAQKMLSEHGEFYPFGATMKPDGTIVQVGAYDGREHPPSQSLIDLLRGAFTASAKSGDIIASATVYDVRTVPPGATEKSDAVAVELDHRDSYSVVVFIPYKVQDHTVQFGQTFAQKGGASIFGRQGG